MVIATSIDNGASASKHRASPADKGSRTVLGLAMKGVVLLVRLDCHRCLGVLLDHGTSFSLV